VAIQCADDRIPEQHAAAAIRLEAVLMRIDHDGIRFARRIECSARFGAEIFREREVAAIGRVGMNAKAEAFAEA